jgi:hypothetical protein
MNFMVIVAHQPMYNPAAWFDWEPMYCRWYLTAWLLGAWFLLTRPYATGVTIFKRKRHA